jgi:arsenate reductase
MLKVLILCTGNSCRSIMAEAALNHLGRGRVHAESAGSKPTGQVHPNSPRLLQSKGIATDGMHSKSWDVFSDTSFDAVITVCDQAAGESCPVFPGAPVKAHWGVPDPAHATGTDAEIMAVFESSYGILAARIHALLQMPLETMSPQVLQTGLREIGQNILTADAA